MFDATKKDGADGVPWFRFYRTERLVTCYYFYIYDRRMGPAFHQGLLLCAVPVPLGNTIRPVNCGLSAVRPRARIR